MTTRKNYNSVIFLTTLSVYLGLALVGAPAPVLAQAALTSKFEFKNKVERKDDLDKNPDENQSLILSIIKLVERLDKLSKEGNFDWNAKNEYEIEDFQLCDEETGKLASYVSDDMTNYQVNYELVKTSFEIAEKFSAKTTELNIVGKYNRRIKYKFSFGNKSFEFQSKVDFDSQQDAQLFNSALANQLASISKPVKEIVAENTKVTLADNQVFIVTRLPRGSLDALLTQRSAK